MSKFKLPLSLRHLIRLFFKKGQNILAKLKVRKCGDDDIFEVKEGTREHQVLMWVKTKKGKVFTAKELRKNIRNWGALDISRVYSCLKILILKGYIERVKIGFYKEIVDD